MMRSLLPRSWQTIVLILVATGLVALALGGYLTPLSRVVLPPLIVAQTWVATRFQAAQEMLIAPSDVTRLRQQNAALETENASLQAQIVALQQQVADVQVLTTLLGFVQAHPENKYVTAAVIGRDPSPFLHYVIINRGSDAGMRRGMPVVTTQGLVGHVAAVTAGAARIQLINDASSAINVRLQQTDVEAVLTGDLTGDVSLQMIPQDAKILAGDLVLTSGLGGNYPPNLLIGQVTGSRQQQADLFQTASVQPLVDFSQLNIVLIITNFRPVDITPLLPTPSAP